AGVERGNFGVAVEHERLAPQQFSDATFPGLAPARMIHVRVDVRVEAVLDPTAVLVPGGGRLGFLQLDLDDALRRLEAILPRHDQPAWGAARFGQRLAVETANQQRERIRPLVRAPASREGKANSA